MRISDWSSDVCSSDLQYPRRQPLAIVARKAVRRAGEAFDGYPVKRAGTVLDKGLSGPVAGREEDRRGRTELGRGMIDPRGQAIGCSGGRPRLERRKPAKQLPEIDLALDRSEEHTSELQSLM